MRKKSPLPLVRNLVTDHAFAEPGFSPDRRRFLRSAACAAVGLACPLSGRAALPDGWRIFEVTTRIEILTPSGKTRVWVPLSLPVSMDYQKPLANRIECDGGKATLSTGEADALRIVTAEFPAGVKPVLSVTERIATRNRTVDVTHSGSARRAGSAELQRFLRPTRLVPVDGVVKDTAAQITRNSHTDLEKARSIYEWIVENTYRNPKTRGCGLGDIRFMLEFRDLGGKCADLNALYVGLARAAGLPARDVYGIRVAPSNNGYKSLGASSSNVTKAQHCRAEVYLSNLGWVPVDPADVRKVMLEEPPGNLQISDQKVENARARLFGSWEMNWIAYNYAPDVALPGSTGRPLGFFMYPHAETADGPLDSLTPESFRYEISATEVSR